MITDYLTVKEVAAKLRLSEWQVRDYARTGALPAVRGPGKHLRFPEDQLVAVMDARPASA